MIAAAYAEKLGMTHMYDDKNRHVPVTILKVTPQIITALRTTDADGYNAMQIGTVGRKHIAKPQLEELKKQNIDLRIAHRTELRVDEDTQVKVGEVISVAIFAPGDKVSITGMSKGKGFAGTIKRHNFKRGPETHGSKNVRQPGSIGGGYPQRVIKGMRMAGHMGAVQSTTRGHKVVAINEAENTIAISGGVPGSNKTRILIRKLGK